MNISDFHLIKGDINAVFHYSSFTLIEVNDLVYDVLTRLKKGESIESVAAGLKLNPADVETLITNLSKAIPDDEQQKAEDAAVKKRKSIGRITLSVANRCNLRCKYCYAGGGSYNQPESMMTLDTASKFIDFCTTHFDKIGTIVFFGGEPLLNPRVIRFICESFENLYKEKEIDYLPEWGVITNGTVLNDDILDLIRQYLKFITVSIDGPQNLNDFNRKFRNGRGSYAKIADFIRKIKNETNTRLKYEATYTSFHRQNNWSEADVKAYLKNEFNIRGTIVPDINDLDDDDKRIEKNKEKSYPEGFFSILNSMAHKIHKEMCLVGTTIVAVSTEGEIYPCHMNFGKKHLSLGSITGSNVFNSQDACLSKFPYLKSVLKTGKPCIDCWANPVCGGCAMRWFYNKETGEYNSLPDNALCEANKKHIENILLLIVRLRKDKDKWAALLENLKTLDDYDYFN